jgi:uncharacterized membrane protein YqjE
MRQPTSEDRRAAEAGGLWDHATTLVAAKLAYFKARLELAGIEAREAGVHFGIIAGLAVVALVMLVFGYFFLVLAAVFLIGWALGGGNAWAWVLLGAALLHLAGTAALLLVAKIKLGRPTFEATLDEFRKDKAWLTPPENVI